MVYQGRVCDGRVVLEAGASLPEGATVFVEIAPTAPTFPGHSPAEHFRRSEEVDRLLGVLRQTSHEGMKAQQRLDRHL